MEQHPGHDGFLYNSWYVAAFDSEIGREPLARMFLNEPVVLYRDEAGAPVALEDRCCHRHLPLSQGRVVGDRLQCGYHGLEFDRDGDCVRVPGQSQIPPGSAIRSYPLAEKWNWIWIWMGDPARADASLIPDWWWAGDENWCVVKGYGGKPLPVACGYQLIADNLLDISHLTYVHASSIGNDAIMDFPIRTERTDNMITMSRMVMDRPAAPFWGWAGKFDGNVDRWLITTCEMPAFVVNDAGSVALGADMRAGHRDLGVEMRVLNAPTPETDTTSHYFYAHARNFGLDDPEVEDAFRTRFTEVFLEDKIVLEGQQQMIDRSPGAATIDINSDAPAIAARRMLDDLIEDERRARFSGAAE
jgi:vanillate monooxygenase